jgi:hypothetical protein
MTPVKKGSDIGESGGWRAPGFMHHLATRKLELLRKGVEYTSQGCTRTWLNVSTCLLPLVCKHPGHARMR